MLNYYCKLSSRDGKKSLLNSAQLLHLRENTALFHHQKCPDSNYEAEKNKENGQTAFLHRFIIAVDYSRK